MRQVFLRKKQEKLNVLKVENINNKYHAELQKAKFVD